jgi:hypothetical protein
MPEEHAERMRRISQLLKQLERVSKQASDLHRMATELSGEATSSIRAAKSLVKLSAADRETMKKRRPARSSKRKRVES